MILLGIAALAALLVFLRLVRVGRRRLAAARAQLLRQSGGGGEWVWPARVDSLWWAATVQDRLARGGLDEAAIAWWWRRARTELEGLSPRAYGLEHGAAAGRELISLAEADAADLLVSIAAADRALRDAVARMASKGSGRPVAGPAAGTHTGTSARGALRGSV